MSDNLESFENENTAPLTHKRILLLMAVVTILCSFSALIVDSWQFALGIGVGGLLSFLNYYWMKWSLKGTFERAVEGQRPGVFGVQYILRYFGFGLVLALIYVSNALPIIAVLLGLGSFAYAIVIEGIIRIFSSNK